MYYKKIKGKSYGPYQESIHAKHHWKPRDVARLLIYLKKSGKHDGGELIASVLDAFKLRTMVCIGVQIFVFLQNTALLGVIILVLKLIKTLLNIWQLFSSGSLKILKIGVLFFKFEIANTILSKMLLRFVAVSLGLDAIIASFGLYIELLALSNPIIDLLDNACSWRELTLEGVEIVAGVADITHKANDIVNNHDVISKAVEELMGMEQDINELSNTDWSN
jgi:hypothetical protein